MAYIEVDIDLYDFDDDELIDEVVRRLKRDTRFKEAFEKELKDLPSEKRPNSMRSHYWMEKINEYISRHCDNLRGVMETEKKLGIQ